jgi:hypothetical protein
MGVAAWLILVKAYVYQLEKTPLRRKPLRMTTISRFRTSASEEGVGNIRSRGTNGGFLATTRWYKRLQYRSYRI